MPARDFYKADITRKNSMTIRAEADKKFLMKFLLISIACFAFGLYCIYDGLIGYPSQLPRARAFAELDHLDDSERTKQWQVIAKEKGWSHGLPDPPEEIEGKILWQWIMLGVCSLVGVPLLIWYFRTKGSWVELDGKTVRTSWGKEFDLTTVTELDKRKWAKKGIAKVGFNQGNTTETFKLDDFMYSRDEMGKILAEVEKHVPADRIIGAELPESSSTKKAESSTSE